MKKDKPQYIFEGSGAPEAKLKPRDPMEELLQKFKQSGVADYFSMPYDIGTALSPDLFWESLEKGLKVFGRYKVYSQIILDFRSDDENAELIKKMLEMAVIPEPIMLDKNRQDELWALKVMLSTVIRTRKASESQVN